MRYYFMPIRIARIKKKKKAKQVEKKIKRLMRCATEDAFCWWECKLLQPPYDIIVSMHSYDPAMHF